MAERLPLSALLSQVLVAFTIECDNEAESRQPHQTTRHGGTAGLFRGPWLVSLAMYSNCVKFLDEQGITVRELERRARTMTNLAGMLRWGYITLEDAATGRHAAKARPDTLIRPREGARKAREVWPQVLGEVEKRWEERFGKEQIARLRASLVQIIGQFDADLPDCMPILGYGLLCRGPDSTEPKSPTGNKQIQPGTDLAALVSKLLLAFALEFERESQLSLAISADVLRVLDEKSVPLRDLPRLAGVSKEAIAMAMGFLANRRLAAVEKDPSGGKFKVARLTAKGKEAREDYRRLAGEIERHWESRFGKNEIGALRSSLEKLVGDGTVQGSPLFCGLEPPPEGWRASVRKPETLPHFPMVLHRGGFPDGS